MHPTRVDQNVGPTSYMPSSRALSTVSHTPHWSFGPRFGVSSPVEPQFLVGPPAAIYGGAASLGLQADSRRPSSRASSFVASENRFGGPPRSPYRQEERRLQQRLQQRRPHTASSCVALASAKPAASGARAGPAAESKHPLVVRVADGQALSALELATLRGLPARILPPVTCDSSPPILRQPLHRALDPRGRPSRPRWG